MKYLIYLIHDYEDVVITSLSVLDKDIKLAKKTFDGADKFLVVTNKPAEDSEVIDFYEWVDEKRTIKKEEIKETEKRLVGLSQEVLDREYKRDLTSFNNIQDSLKNSGGTASFLRPVSHLFDDVKNDLKYKLKSLKEELELLSKVK